MTLKALAKEQVGKGASGKGGTSISDLSAPPPRFERGLFEFDRVVEIRQAGAGLRLDMNCASILLPLPNLFFLQEAMKGNRVVSRRRVLPEYHSPQFD